MLWHLVISTSWQYIHKLAIYPQDQNGRRCKLPTDTSMTCPVFDQPDHLAQNQVTSSRSLTIFPVPLVSPDWPTPPGKVTPTSLQHTGELLKITQPLALLLTNHQIMRILFNQITQILPLFHSDLLQISAFYKSKLGNKSMGRKSCYPYPHYQK